MLRQLALQGRLPRHEERQAGKLVVSGSRHMKASISYQGGLHEPYGRLDHAHSQWKHASQGFRDLSYLRSRKGILEALWREGFIFGYQVLENEQESKVYLKYSEGKPVIQQIRLASKPGKPLYANVKQLKNGSKEEFIHGIDLDHSKGVLSDREAISLNQGRSGS